MTEIKKDGEAGWFSENIVDPEFRRSYERETAAEDFLGQIEAIMRARGLSRTQLAKIMECNPANITKVMRTTNNLKLSTMVDMALALDHRIRITLQVAGTESVHCESPSYWPRVPHQVQEDVSGKAGDKSHLWLVRDGDEPTCQISKLAA
jgi:hypothetical protein